MSTMENDIDEAIETAASTNNEGNEEDSIPVKLVDGNNSFEGGDGAEQAVVNQLIPEPELVQQQHQKPKSKQVPRGKRPKVSPISRYTKVGHNGTANTKPTKRPRAKKAAAAKKKQKPKPTLMSQNRSLRRKLSICDEKITQKEAEIEEKNREITKLERYKRRSEEADDKSYQDRRKHKQVLQEERATHSLLMNAEKQSNEKQIKKVVVKAKKEL